MPKKKFAILITLLSLVLGIGFLINSRLKNQDANLNIQPSPTIDPSPSIPLSPTLSPTAETLGVSVEELPESFLIANVPFQSQAPFALWDELHDEACEEASVALSYYYLNNKDLTAEAMDQEILKMVDWEVQKWGSHKDLTVQETLEMAKEYYDMRDVKVETDISIEDIKREIAQNHLVILPTAGRLLGNPYFRQPGPIYHMVVVIGYDDNTIIVQDVGTKRGDHYVYSEKILYNAIHDWNGSPDNIESGPKAMLVVW